MSVPAWVSLFLQAAARMDTPILSGTPGGILYRESGTINPGVNA